jgi:hypothetical protein
VVALQPDLEEVLELAVSSQIRGRQVAVVIQDRFVFRELVIQPPGGLIG